MSEGEVFLEYARIGADISKFYGEKMDAREVRFFGKITAGFTHEMKNVLAIIRESAGLMEDLMAMQRDAPFPHQERFARALGAIASQVKRGIELSTRLNRFAHSPDELLATCDLNDTLVHVVVMAERFARLKGVQLHLKDPEGNCSVTTSPVRLQMAIFETLQCLWNQLSAGGDISCSVRNEANKLALNLQCRCEPALFAKALDGVQSSDEWESVKEVVESIEGKLELDMPGCRLIMLLPRSSE